MQKEIHEALKELYGKPVKAPEELRQKTLRKMEENQKRKTFVLGKPAVAVASVFAMTALLALWQRAALAEGVKKFFHGFWKQQTEVASYVKTGIYEDSDGHVTVSVEEMLSDQVCVQAVVKVQAEDKEGKNWLKEKHGILNAKLCLTPDQESKGVVSGSSDVVLLKECSSDTVNYYAVYYEGSEWSEEMEQCTFSYFLPGSGQKKVKLDSRCNVPVYEYELKPEGNQELSRYIEPKRIRLTKLSCVVFGKNHGLFRKSKLYERILLDHQEYEKELLKQIVLLGPHQYRKTLDWSFSMGDANEEALERYTDCDAVVFACGLSGLAVSEDRTAKASVTEIQPETITGIILQNSYRTVNYEFDAERGS